jgi:hypothetical protein
MQRKRPVFAAEKSTTVDPSCGGGGMAKASYAFIGFITGPRSPGTEARTIGLSHPCLCRLGKSKPLSTEHCASMGVFAKSLRSSQYSVFCPDPMISFRQLRTSMMRRFVAIFDISSNIFMAFALLLQGTFQKRALPWMF